MKRRTLLVMACIGLAGTINLSFTKADSFRKLDLSGAWSSTATVSGKPAKHMLVMTDGYFSMATYAEADGSFITTLGGSYSNTDNSLSVTLEFNSSDPSSVGQPTTLNLKETKEGFTVSSSDGSIYYAFTNVDKGKPGALAGPWLMSGRKTDDGSIANRDTSGPRKTMKILSGTRFQWIAFNTSTGEFFGTGGGNYTTKGGKYTENIEFFSRDNTRVGAALQFDYSLKEGAWHHSGLSSKGDPIYEVWSKR
ncbi:MAG: membrane or secreted protein [Imperialibacter sp.]